MTTFQELADDLRVATHVNITEVSEADMLAIAKLATRHLVGLGVLIDQNDADTTLVVDDWQYAVPAGYIYVQFLEYEDTINAGVYWEQVPNSHWQFRATSGGTQIAFYKDLFDLRFSQTPGNKVRWKGQGRPAVPTALGNTVSPEVVAATQQAMEHLIFGRVSQARSELAFDRSQQRREVEAVLLGLDLVLPDTRVRPGSRRVHGR